MGSLFPILQDGKGSSTIRQRFGARVLWRRRNLLGQSKGSRPPGDRRIPFQDASAGTSDGTASRRVHDHDPVMRVSSQLQAFCLGSTPSYSLSARGP
eukprot:scaffold810_cov355-Pavlova_lutheri.AAC.9